MQKNRVLTQSLTRLITHWTGLFDARELKRLRFRTAKMGFFVDN